jgi:site-specific DNA recombinase
MKKAVIMCRVSSDEQAKGYSLDVQLEAITNYCQRNDHEVVKHYKEDYSAKNFNRPAWKKFMEYAKKNKKNIDVLMITSWDRFSRNQTDALIEIRKLKKLGIAVQAIQQPLDMDIPENKAILSFYLALPEIDNERKSIKVKEAIRAAQKAGRWSRFAPYGYTNTRDQFDKPLIVQNEHAKAILYIFEEYVKGKQQVDIWPETKKMGLKASRNNIGHILKSVVYMGKILVPKNEDEPEMIVEGTHEGIVSETLFHQVQDLLAGKRKISKFPSKVSQKDQLPFRGLLACSKCSKMLTGSGSRSRSGDRHYYYHCNHCRKERFRADTSNQVLFNGLEDLEFTKDAKTLYNATVKKLLKDSGQSKEQKVKSLKLGIEKLENKIEKLQDLLMEEKISITNFTQMSERFNKDRGLKAEELTDISTQNTDYEAWIKKGVNYLCTIHKRLKKSSITDMQTIIRSIYPENLQFHGKYYRTEKMNEFVNLLLNIDKGCRATKKGQLNKYIKLTYKAPLVGLELSILMLEYNWKIDN